MAEQKTRVRIKQGHGIGGIGYAGQEVSLTKEEAEKYADYIEPIEEPAPAEAKSAQDEEGEDHKIMKPQTKRTSRSRRKPK